MIEGFDELQFLSLDRCLNDMVNALAKVTSTSSIIHSDVAKGGKCIVDIIHRPSIPDYEEHWVVFEDDKDIANFL